MSKDDARINELTTALQTAEQRLAQREALVTTAIAQTETVRSQYEQANERAETLRRRLEAKDEQLRDLQSQLETVRAELTVSRESLATYEQRIGGLQNELRHRDERIAALERLHAESDSALDAIHQDAKQQQSANANEHVAAMNLQLESLDTPSTRYSIARATTTLGRAPANDISINSTSVSRYHARIMIESGKVFLVDLKSTNGCSVNGRGVSRHSISDGDVIGIGDAKFKLTIDAPLPDIDDAPMRETHILLDKAAIHDALHGSTHKPAEEPAAGKPKKE